MLLTGLAFCASCGGAMTLRTGTGRNGTVHRYYACASCERKGKTACKGRSVRMDRLDSVVTETIAERLLQPERIAVMLGCLTAKRADKAAAVDERIGRLDREVRASEERLQRLYRLVEDGVAELDDLLKARIATLKAERESEAELCRKVGDGPGKGRRRIVAVKSQPHILERIDTP
jgi:site-specific DNA recombinase